MTTTISVLWPAVGLSEKGWRQRVEDLATRAESLIGRKCTLQQTAELSLALCGLLWPVLGSPETVSASCRASLVMGAPGVLLASSPGDQWSELCQRLDDIYAAAQADPSAAAIEMPSPLLQRVIPDSHGGRPRRVRSQPQVDEPELIPEPVEADQPSELPEPPQAVEAHQQLNSWGFLDEPELEPELEPEPEPAPLPPAPDTNGWFLVAEAAELLGVKPAAINTWRRLGKLGERGVNWWPRGKTYLINPTVLDLLIGVPAGAGT